MAPKRDQRGAPSIRRSVSAIGFVWMAACAARQGEPTEAPVDQKPASGASSRSRSEESAAVVQGRVVGQRGEPLEGALVAATSHFDVATTELTYHEQRTNAGGRFRFATLPPGRYGITATPSGAGAVYGGICEVPSPKPCEVVLRAGGSGVEYTGRVRDERGAALGGARVLAAALNDNIGEVYAALTDREGRYALELPPSSEYMLVADAPPRPRTPRRVSPAATKIDFELGAAPAPRPSDAVIRAWLKKRATPLSPRDSLDAARTRALAAIVGKARVVGLGDAARGGGDFTDWRRRVLEALVEDAGFTVYAAEVSAADALVVEDYVLHGKGSARSVLRALHAWKDQTEQNLALIEWMRAYNADPKHRKKIHYAGFDPMSPRATTELVDYLRRVDPEAAHAADHDLAQLARPDAPETYARLSDAEREHVRVALEAVTARLDSQRKAYIARSSAAAYARARQHARIVRRAAIAQAAPVSRDEQMFETLRELVSSHPRGTRIAIDAHNGHIAAEPRGLFDLGRRLRAQWGQDYVAITFAFGEGRVRALDASEGRATNELREIRVEPAPRDTFDGALALAGLPAFLLDLRTTRGAVGAWLASPQPMRSMGARFSGQAASFQLFTPARAFDAVLYVGAVSPIRPIR